MNPSEKRRKYGENYAVWLRNYQRCRQRALTRLGNKYPDEYQQLLEEERARDEAEGKTWLDISGRTKRDTLADATDRTGEDARRPSNHTTPRNVGGEA